jgi:3-oxoacyl-[acyl-carrier protein] reductase
MTQHALPQIRFLKEKCAIVTGASRGLGLGIARELGRCGARVVVNYVQSVSEAEAAVRSIREEGGEAVAVQADVSQADEVERLFGEAEGAFGTPDILVNNAGTSAAQDIFETTLEDWQRILRINLDSVFLCSKAAMSRMKETGSGGHIINISSIVAHQGALAGHVHYAATKSGMLGVTRTLARTGAPLGIHVNAVAPGIIDTELLGSTHGVDGVRKLASTVPLGLGTIEDVGYSVAFLCGPGGRYITGAVLDVNGGLYMG